VLIVYYIPLLQELAIRTTSVTLYSSPMLIADGVLSMQTDN